LRREVAAQAGRNRKKEGRKRMTEIRSWQRGALLGWAAIGILGLVGCVPYQTYKKVCADLEGTKQAHNDLVKQYSIAINKLKEKGIPEDGAYAPELERLRAENALLRQQRDTTTIPFSREHIGQLAGAQEETGGIRLGEALLFNEGEALLKSDQLPVLDQLVNLLKRSYAGETIIIEGHTDNQPLRRVKASQEDNSNLGYNRARAVFKYLKAHGFAEEQMVVTTYGFTRPIDPATANTEDGRRQNRRVVIRRGGTKI
jgi:outer membrane protein OmpA-like peptidoglycan-associated protein